MLALLAVLLPISIAAPAGIKVIVPVSTLSALRNASMPLFSASIQSQAFQNITRYIDPPFLPSVNLTIYNLTVNKIAEERLESEFQFVAPSTVIARISKLDIGVSFLWKAKSWVDTQGAGNAWINNTSITISLNLGTRNESLFIARKATNVTIGHCDVLVSRSGLSWFYNLLLDIFKQRVTTQIATSIKQRISALVDKSISKINRHSVFPMLFPGVGVDLHLASPVAVSVDRLRADFRGRFINLTTGDFPEMPKNVSTFSYYGGRTPDMVEIAVSEDVLLSALIAAYRLGKLQWSLFPNMLGALSPLRLTTSWLDSYFPGLLQIYGDREVYFRCEVQSPPALTVRFSGLIALLDTYCSMRIVNFPAKVASLQGKLDLTGYLSASSDLLQVYLAAGRFSALTAKLDYKNETTELPGFSEAINLALNMLLPYSFGRFRLTIPFLPSLTAKDISITAWDGFIVLTTRLV